MCILLTEDNEINQQIAVELLEGAGATVKIANNGREAVAILEDGPQPPPFNVVLMDLQMPEMDGYQATARLRSDPRFSALPIVAMTAHATIEERQRCLAAGMNDHISKPIDPRMLFETVSRFYKPNISSVEGLTAEPPAERASAEVGESLPAISGLDTKDGLSRVAGNAKLYAKLLRQFVEQQGPAVGQISAALAKGDVGLAERLAHTVKGVAGNIGAKAVQAAAGGLEKLIRDRAAAGEVESAKKELAVALSPLLPQLRVALPAPARETPPAESVVNPAESRAIAAQMASLLAEFDAGAADFMEANRPALCALFPGEAWAAFEKLVEAYSFAEAQAQLEQALKKLPPG